MKSIKVIKIGGKLIENEEVLASLCDELSSLGEAFVLVHGGGVMGSHLAEKLGVEVKMHEGRRITDAATLDIAVMAYAGLANKRVVAALQARGVDACGLSGCDMGVVVSHRRPVGEIDWGYVGDVEHVRADVLAMLLDAGVTPVISPITCSTAGELLNTNADTVAQTVAVGMSAVYETELVYCCEKRGVLLDVNDDDSVIAEITPDRFAELRTRGIVADGMLPKLENAFRAIDSGVRSVAICSADRIASPGYGGTTLRK